MAGFGWRRPTTPRGRMCACGLNTLAAGEARCFDCERDAAQDADYQAHGDARPRHMVDKVGGAFKAPAGRKRGPRR
jgi:hypothetical protein